MRGWLADYFRSLVAPWYWNTRKTLYVLRGRQGQCPCHNPSDSGRPGETRCEAVVFWRSPARFSRAVCPLLVRAADGQWYCGARPEQVRAFWGRPFRVYAVTGFAVAALTGTALWGTMRAVGYEVSLRQVFWPLAWHEIRGVRAEFFRKQSSEHLAAGRFRDALASLTVAYELQPEDYGTAMYLAQVLHLARPEQADGFFRLVYERHPAKRDETARVWFRSLLARAQLPGVADLARRRLAEAPAEWPVWAHALLFVTRVEGRPELLGAAVADPKVPAAARAVLDFEARLRRKPVGEARVLLATEPMPSEPYAILHRVERWLEWGDGKAALELLQLRQASLQQRDIVRLTLAAHAVARNEAILQREVRGLLGRGGDEQAAALALVAQHLIRFPNPTLLEAANAAAAKVAAGRAPARGDALAALYCAVVLGGGPREWLGPIRVALAAEGGPSVAAERRVEEALSQPGFSPLLLLTVVRPMSLELNYAVIDRAAARR
jgi:hypothetical protein